MTKEERSLLVARQIKRLNRHGIYPVESRVMAKMVVVKKADLEQASKLKISDEITIASRY